MINITYKLTNLCFKLINQFEKKKLFCKKMRNGHLLSQNIKKKVIYYKYSIKILNKVILKIESIQIVILEK